MIHLIDSKNSKIKTMAINNSQMKVKIYKMDQYYL